MARTIDGPKPRKPIFRCGDMEQSQTGSLSPTPDASIEEEDFDSSNIGERGSDERKKEQLSPGKGDRSVALYDSPRSSKNFFDESKKSKWLSSKCPLYVSIILLGVLIPISTRYLYPSGSKCEYTDFAKKYPNQNPRMWRSLSTSIENILNKTSKAPYVNLFVHQGGADMENLVKEIAVKASKCFGDKFKLVEMNQDDFISPKAVKDYGTAIEIFKKKIRQGHVAVIVKLNKIPPEAARALHTICDTHTPIAEEIVIFLTLHTKKTDKPIANAENTLRELWGSKLKDYDLDPLITRVTDQVFALRHN